VRVPGSHTRSGNSMLRTRAAILSAAEACIARVGVRRTTMSEVRSAGGIAKATLYNHFRAKNDLLEGLALARVEELAARAVAAAGLVEGLELAAAELSASPALRRIRADEPEVLAVVACPGAGRVWDAARTGVSSVLVAAGLSAQDEAVDLVLRWLASQAAAPADDALLAGGARLLAAVVMTASAGHAP
jgi:AcrR family transcriptional regulator